MIESNEMPGKGTHLRMVPREGEVRTPQQIVDGASNRVGQIIAKISAGHTLEKNDLAELARIQGELGNIKDDSIDDRLRTDAEALRKQCQELGEPQFKFDNL